MHNHDGKGNNSMMWMMIICCAVPLLLIVLFGFGGKAFGVSTWVIFGGIGVMVLAHFFMMGKSHKHDSGSDEKHEDYGNGPHRSGRAGNGSLNGNRYQK